MGSRFILRDTHLIQVIKHSLSRNNALGSQVPLRMRRPHTPLQTMQLATSEPFDSHPPLQDCTHSRIWTMVEVSPYLETIKSRVSNVVLVYLGLKSRRTYPASTGFGYMNTKAKLCPLVTFRGESLVYHLIFMHTWVCTWLKPDESWKGSWAVRKMNIWPNVSIKVETHPNYDTL